MSARNLGKEEREAATGSGLRSQQWFGAEGKTGFMHRSWLRSEGLPDDSFRGRPVIGIANSWSELTNWKIHLRAPAEHVKRGNWQAGGPGLAPRPPETLPKTAMRAAMGPDHDIFQCGHMAEQTNILKGAGYSHFRHLMRPQADNRLSAKGDPAPAWRKNAGNQVEKIEDGRQDDLSDYSGNKDYNDDKHSILAHQIIILALNADDQ